MPYDWPKTSADMILVIADDITGAAEMAGKAMEFGLSVGFLCSFDGSVKRIDTTDVLVVATNSRSLAEPGAVRLHRRLLTKLSQTYSGPTIHFYKKCDSAVRGYVLSELIPMAEHTGISSVVLQPANPAAGRRIELGHYSIHDQPLHQSPFRTDPDFPATTSDVRQLLLARSPRFAATPAFEYTLADCRSEEEMAQQLQPTGLTSHLYAGSTAFFGQYLKIVHRHVPAQVLPSVVARHEAEAPYLLLSGSAHAGTYEMQQYFEEKGRPVIQLPAELRQPACSAEAIRTFADRQVQTIIDSPGKSFMLSTGGPGETYPAAPEVLNQRLCRLAQLLVDKLSIEHIYISGGATTWQFISEMNWTSLVPVLSPAPGVIRLKVADRPGTSITIKPGSYAWGIAF